MSYNIWIVGENTFRLGQNGYLLDHRKWNWAFTSAALTKMGILLTGEIENWVNVVREYYDTFGRTPIEKAFVHYCTRKNLQYDRMKELLGGLDNLCKIGGLSKPGSCWCGQG